MSIRQRRLTPAEELAVLDAWIKRTQTRLLRTGNALNKGLKRRRLLERKLLAPTPTPPAAASPPPTPASPTPPPSPSDLSIPDFLQRKKPAQRLAEAEAKVAEVIKQELEENKKAKARGRIAKLKADKAGETKRMPLQGKEAFAFIQGK